jgi:hypothetical protein
VSCGFATDLLSCDGSAMAWPRAWIAAFLIASGVGLGCGSAAPVVRRPAVEPATPAKLPAPPLPLAEDPPRLAADVAAMWEALALRLHAAGIDCTAATAAVTGVRTEFAAVIAAQATLVSGGRGADLDRALDTFSERLAAAVSKLTAAPALEGCAGSTAFTNAFDRWPDPDPVAPPPAQPAPRR